MRAVLVLLLPAGVLLPGCLADAFFGDSVADVQARLRSEQERVRRDVEEQMVRPRPPTPKKAAPKPPTVRSKLVLDLPNAMSVATTGRLLPGRPDSERKLGRTPGANLSRFWNQAGGGERVAAGNRTFLTSLEGLYRSLLSLRTTEHGWDPQLSGTISYVFSNSHTTGPHQDTSNGSLGLTVSQKLPFGGTATLNIDTSRFQGHMDSSNRSADLSFSGSISQPLLKGFGYDRARESVVQGRRSLTYSVRSFELYRQDFAIDVMRRYYNLIRQRAVVGNNRTAHEQALFTLRQTQALYEKLGEKTTLDVLRAELGEQRARDTLDESQRSFEEALDSFREFLGLDPAVEVELKDEKPRFREVRMDAAEAARAALANRLDLRNALSALEDTVRSVRYAKQDLWPSLDLLLSANVTPQTFAQDFDDLRLRSHSFSASLTLEIPLDRIAERNALRSLLLSFQQQIRSFQLEVDSVKRQVRTDLRTLRRLERSMANQKRQIEIARRKVRKAFLDYKEGQISNRDLVEAQEELREAENALIQTQVDHEIGRVQLLRDMGVLRLDASGNIKE